MYFFQIISAEFTPMQNCITSGSGKPRFNFIYEVFETRMCQLRNCVLHHCGYHDNYVLHISIPRKSFVNLGLLRSLWRYTLCKHKKHRFVAMVMVIPNTDLLTSFFIFGSYLKILAAYSTSLLTKLLQNWSYQFSFYVIITSVVFQYTF